ncbi:hypothetical protein ACLB2K_011987 [Fragaria x ananassa]
MWRLTFKSSNTRHVVCGKNLSLSVDGSLISEREIQTEMRLEWSHGDTRVWVAYACSPEEGQQHFESYRTVNRVTMLTDKCGQPKGFAYVEFPEAEAIQEALALNESELHGRPLKVLPKSVPGYKQFRSGRNNPYMGYHFRGPYVPSYFYSRMDMGTFQGSEGQQDTCPTVRRLLIMKLPYHNR